jgi:hypothetical protein
MIVVKKILKIVTNTLSCPRAFFRQFKIDEDPDWMTFVEEGADWGEEFADELDEGSRCSHTLHVDLHIYKKDRKKDNTNR